MPRANWTEDDLAKLLRVRSGVVGRPEGRKLPRATDPAHARPGRAEGTRLTSSPYKSKLEAAWAEKLKLEELAGFIRGWQYEPANLRLPGEKNFYKPDFLVRGWEGIRFYEVKGRNMSDDASLVKIKTAAATHPWAVFIQVKRIDGAWEEREFPCPI